MSRLEELLKGAKEVALGGHIRPDGDCVGSVRIGQDIADPIIF